ncbi:tetratricopeptide repeat protein [Clostridium taeniosporum]|uniref:Tetratricopeptide repeat protein n=1 Tax=Clostridium taeniosporum TaxID=394958 RepID=A0A1D7XH69_9CLOT|nr:tetratricopeptide repeat protein [Clostridium taeniosporum]AOR22450.1 hypothetical protein BGI42_01320 [Clostridium taeniosporum]
MKKASKRYYDKAIKYYQNGELSKSLKICEEGLSCNLKNPSILNLKGLILYQQGKLKEAITVWKINKDINNNEISKNYINSAKEDEVRVELYELGEKKLKELKIGEAIAIFKKCKESDFNCIKVNTALALCYQKKGEINKCITYMNKVLSTDKNYIVAKQIKKQLIEIKAYKKDSNGLIKWIIGILMAFIFATTIYVFKDNFKINNKKDSNTQISQEEVNINKSEVTNTEEVKEPESKIPEETISESTVNEEKKKAQLDLNRLNEYLENAEFDNIYYVLENVNEQDIPNDYKGVYRKCINLLKTSGIEEFYRKGMEEYNKENYENANVEFNKAYTYSNGNYLREHIVFYNAVTLEQLNNFDEAIKLYELYYEEYPNSSYTDNALYNLSLILSSINKEKSVYYASKLVDNFPDSMYINETINQILNS